MFRGLVQHGGFADVAVLNQLGLSSEQLAEELASSIPGSSSLTVSSARLWDTHQPSRCGTLLRGQPYLDELAWLRRSEGLDHHYSLVGLIHTIAPPAIRQRIGATALAPTHPWDALICTSPAVQQAMEAMFDGWAEHLAARVGAVRAPRPQLPLIPLAVDVPNLQRQGSDAKARVVLRQRLSIAADELLVLWVGRLSYFEKAFPQVMFEAVARAAHASGQTLHFVLLGWFPGGDADLKLYQQAADLLAPGLKVTVLDGNQPELLAQCWAAADIFLSLVDNIQETFGLAPVEAMAAGLPVVVSDWDGYRYTVRDGVDGFCIPTLGSPGGAPGALLAHLHALELETYQTYVGATAQHTAVHVERAAAALTRLAQDPELRRCMGAAGQQRAAQLFSWPAVVAGYGDLFDQLADLRLAADPEEARAGAALQPLRGEPFADFRGFATHVLEPDLWLRLAEGVQPEHLQDRLQVQLHRLYPGLRGQSSEAQQLMLQLQRCPGGCSVQQLLSQAPEARRPYLETTLVWLAKLGCIDWLPATADSAPLSAGSPSA